MANDVDLGCYLPGLRRWCAAHPGGFASLCVLERWLCWSQKEAGDAMERLVTMGIVEAVRSPVIAYRVNEQ